VVLLLVRVFGAAIPLARPTILSLRMRIFNTIQHKACKVLPVIHFLAECLLNQLGVVARRAYTAGVLMDY